MSSSGRRPPRADTARRRRCAPRPDRAGRTAAARRPDGVSPTRRTFAKAAPAEARPCSTGSVDAVLPRPRQQGRTLGAVPDGGRRRPRRVRAIVRAGEDRLGAPVDPRRPRETLGAARAVAAGRRSASSTPSTTRRGSRSSTSSPPTRSRTSSATPRSTSCSRGSRQSPNLTPSVADRREARPEYAAGSTRQWARVSRRRSARTARGGSPAW